MVHESPNPWLQSQMFFLFMFFMHLSSLSGALHIVKQDIAMLEKDHI